MPTDAELQAIADGTPAPIATNTDNVGGATPETETPKPSQLEPKDDDLVPLLVNGAKVYKPWKEVRDGGQRQEDYTRGKQEVAARLKEVKELYEGLSAKQKELFDKEAAIDAVMGRTPATKPGAVHADDDIVPYKTLKETVAEMLKAEREESDKAQNARFQQMEESRTFARWEEKIADTVEKLTKEHPVLAKIPNLIGALKREAQGDRPQSEAEMLAAVVKHGKLVAKSIDDDYSERSKQDAINRKKLRESGPEPAGGQTAFKAPEKSYVKGRKIDWDGLEKDVIAQISAMDED